MKNKNVVCIIQARMESGRLPGKILLDLEGKPVLLRGVDRVLESKKINQVVVATTIKPHDQEIADLIKNYHPRVAVFRGSEEDLLDRYYQAAKEFKAGIIIRITSDCPLIDSEVLDKVINVFLQSGEDIDYVANILIKRTYPRGLDVEVFSFNVLEKMWREIKREEKYYREHVTSFIRGNPDLFKCKNITHDIDYSFHRWTLDVEEDYGLIKIIYQELYPKNPNFKMKEIIELFNKRPELIKINQDVEQKNPHL